MQNLKLYGHYDSGHVYKVMLFLELAKIPYDYEEVDIWIDKEKRRPGFLQLSRNGEVPCLVIDGQAVIQSNVILHKLASIYQMFGGESVDRLIRSLDWQFWEANRLGMCLPQLRYARRFAPDEFSQDSLEFLKSRFNQDIELLSNHFSDGRQFILDDQVSIADFSICGYLYWADEAGIKLPQQVNGWLERLSKIDGWQPPYEMMKRSINE